MGVPGLYSWLLRRWSDLSDPIDSAFSCENLYVDMNGIIHPCCHSDNSLLDKPTTDQEKFKRIGEELIDLIRVSKPQNVVYLAVDGVAPRAKMNHQRSRRYMGIAEQADRKKAMEQIRQYRTSKGYPMPKEGVVQPWDSNVITPGTEFMSKLDAYLRTFIAKQVSENPEWKNLTIIFSDSSVPGEGEHKLLDYIRHQKSYQQKQSEESGQLGIELKGEGHYEHCIVSDDADLVFLSLGLKQQKVCILRDDFRRVKQVLKMQDFPYRRLLFRKTLRFSDPIKYEVFQVDEMKRTLEDLLLDGMPSQISDNFDFDRAVNDVILLSFFGGNDFLPHLPAVDIREGVLEMFLNIYKELQSSGKTSEWKYLTSQKGEILFSNFQEYTELLSGKEILHASAKKTVQRIPKGLQQCKDFLEGTCKKGSRCYYRHGDFVPRDLTKADIRATISNFALGNFPVNKKDVTTPEFQESYNGKKKMSLQQHATKTKYYTARIQDDKLFFQGVTTSFDRSTIIEFARRNELFCDVKGSAKDTVIVSRRRYRSKKWSDGKKLQGPTKKEKLLAEAILAEEFAEEVDRYSLPEDLALIDDNSALPQFSLDSDEKETWQEFKQEYYFNKFNLADKESVMKTSLKVAEEYMVALQWTVQYYINGCSSWSWFYPYHFGPFPSDLNNFLKNTEKGRLADLCNWETTKPVSPVEQLINVMPLKSVSALPKACQKQVEELKPPINDIFVDPRKVDRDPNGRTYKYQWVSLLPILQPEQITTLSATVNETKPLWSKTEQKRDQFGDMELYCNKNIPFASELKKSQSNGGNVTKLGHQSGLYGFIPRVGSQGKDANVLVAPYKLSPGRGFSTTRRTSRLSRFPTKLVQYSRVLRYVH